MGRYMTAKHFAAASTLLPIAGIVAWSDRLWMIAIFIIWFVSAAAYWVVSERKAAAERVARTIHSMQTAGVRTLNHHRHDWMNDLQVLYGYIRLGKLDKTVQYVETIRARMAAESAIAKLGVPSLVSFIQSFRTMSNSLQLEVSVKGELNLNELALDSERIAELLIHTINAYRFSAKSSYDSHSSLKLELSADDEALYAAFYYEGELINEQHWEQKITKQLEGAPLRPVSAGQSFAKVLLRADMRA